MALVLPCAGDSVGLTARPFGLGLEPRTTARADPSLYLPHPHIPSSPQPGMIAMEDFVHPTPEAHRERNGDAGLFYFSIIPNDCARGSQVLRHLIREWIHKLPTVSLHHPAKPQPRERAWESPPTATAKGAGLG